ncbi:ROK family transcriptional regulator [Microlunatus sp. Gsoil 973]|uniref:ROK family transcriptional regulator n=1 Tax=Microlunatus sp. Gsoil 973 TaxID=2672569 RepID=UPI001E59BEF2|nr:ROK family transcriptional regulator [Microlunatus sp. Gsoil 973]
MLQRGSNLPRVGDYNEVLVMDLIRRHPGISRIELAERTGLSGQTVLNICRRLIGKNLINQIGQIRSGAGGRRLAYQVVPDGRYAIGVDIDPARTVLIAVNLAGEVIDRMPLRMDDHSDIDQIVAGIDRATRDHLSRGRRGTLSGLGVALPRAATARCDPADRQQTRAGWNADELRDSLRSRLRIPVRIGPDAVAAATAELWAGTIDSQNFAFIYLGASVGAGVALGGEILRGETDNLGRLDHLGGDPNGPVCACGGRGCIGAVAEPSHLVVRARDLGLLNGTDPDDPVSTAAGIVELGRLAEYGDSAAAEVLDYAARTYGRAAATLAGLLDLDTIVFGGPNWPPLEPAFRRIVPQTIEALVGAGAPEVTMRSTTLGGEVGSIGAASLLLAETAGPFVAHLVLPA